MVKKSLFLLTGSSIFWCIQWVLRWVHWFGFNAIWSTVWLIQWRRRWCRWRRRTGHFVAAIVGLLVEERNKVETIWETNEYILNIFLNIFLNYFLNNFFKSNEWLKYMNTCFLSYITLWLIQLKPLEVWIIYSMTKSHEKMKTLTICWINIFWENILNFVLVLINKWLLD